MTSQITLGSPDLYGIAWIAVLSIERAAAEAMLDEEHAAPTGFARHQTDANVYTWGRMGEHNIVIASLASGIYGATSATTTALTLLSSLPSIRVGLLVGIGAGAARPDEGYDIRLGDIAVGHPRGSSGGVCQYDSIKAESGDHRKLNGFLGLPPPVLLNALTSIRAYHEREDSEIPRFLQEMLERNPKMGKSSKQNPGYSYQGVENDRLFKALYDHTTGPAYRGCEPVDVIQRDTRGNTNPEIHYGTIVSGNTHIKDPTVRDRIIAEVGEHCVCFEMEAAGLMNPFPCLVIRGICDYADSHKNNRWQRYAAATAAAYAKELLLFVPVSEVQETRTAKEALESVRESIQIVQQTTTATQATADFIKFDLHTDNVRRWLSPPDQSTSFNHAKKLRHEGTGAWLLKDPVFESWHLGSRRHLWLKGLAGCGKTVLSTTVLDHLAKVNNGPILSFFFDFGDTAKQTFDGMLRSLVFQLYQGGFDSASHIDTLFECHQRGSNQAATKTLEDMISKMLMTPRLVFIVLDALDESTTRVELLQWIKDMISSPGLAHVKLLYTSRPEAEFLDHIPPLIGKESCLLLNETAVNIDIQSWVAAQLAQRREFARMSLSQDLLKEIREMICNKAAGMFRWAFCQLNSLARCHSQRAMEKALETLPRDLNETYERMLASIPTELASDAIRLLQFLVHTEQPLTVDQAKEVIATQIENKPRGFDAKRRPFSDLDVLDYCPNLIILVDTQDGEKELHLAHFSVKEYLLDQPTFEITTASIPMTDMCLTYLCGVASASVIRDDIKEITRYFPMVHHATELWARYASFAQASTNALQRMIRFLEEETAFQFWARLYHPYDKKWEENYTGPMSSRLYYVSSLGLALLAQELIDNGADVDAQGGYYGNALQAACVNHNRASVDLLIRKNADINIQGGEYGNALQAACAYGNQKSVELLISKGADTNIQGGYYGNTLQAACVYSHREMVELLVSKGVDINAQGGEYGNALQAACTSANGYRGIVEFLISKGADVNAQGGYYGNALQAACTSTYGYQEIVELLISKGADINAQGGYYGNALQAACRTRHPELVEFLIKKGADINMHGGYYSNALRAICIIRDGESVLYQISDVADTNMKGGHHGTAVYAVYDTCNQRIVRMPQSKGAITMPSKRPSSPTPTNPARKLRLEDGSSDAPSKSWIDLRPGVSSNSKSRMFKCDYPEFWQSAKMDTYPWL